MSRQQRQQEISALERKLRDLKHEEQRHEEHHQKTRSILDDHSRTQFLETYRKKKQTEQASIDRMEQSIKAKRDQIRKLETDIKQMESTVEETHLKKLESFIHRYSYFHGARRPSTKLIQVYTCLLEDDISKLHRIIGYRGEPYQLSEIGKLICKYLGHLHFSCHIAAPCYWCTTYKHPSS